MSASLDRLKSSLFGLIRMVQAEAKFFGHYEYELASQSGNTIDASPTDPALNLPMVGDIVILPGVDSVVVQLPPGYRLLIGFVNGDRKRPYVASGNATTKPLELALDASDLVALGASATAVEIAGGVLGCARMTDPVLAGPFAGTITMGSTKTKVG